MGPLELCLMGDPIAHNRSQVKEVTRELKDDFLQFDLKPNLDAGFFGQRYTTNSRGMRDREYTLEKPAGRLPDRPARLVDRHGLGSRDATTPMKTCSKTGSTPRPLAWAFPGGSRCSTSPSPPMARCSATMSSTARRWPFQPDMVLFSSTMLDPRLVEIHLGGLIKNNVDLKYDFFRKAMAEAGIDVDRERKSGWADLDQQGGFKARVKEHYWTFADAVLGTLAADCRSLGLPLVCLLVPPGQSRRRQQGPGPVRRPPDRDRRPPRRPLDGLSTHLRPVESARVEIAPGDDHPNTLGHRLLFEKLSHDLLTNPDLAQVLF